MTDPTHLPPHATALDRYDTLYLHDLMMLLQLPDGGVNSVLRDAAAYKDHFLRTRWPDGPTCPRCGGSSVQVLPKRDLFQCRECRKQFTATSGTVLHKTHLPIQMWLLATEAMIRRGTTISIWSEILINDLCSLLGIHTEAAANLRWKITEDIKFGGVGLLGRAVCMKKIDLPADIAPYSKEHLTWASDLANTSSDQ